MQLKWQPHWGGGNHGQLGLVIEDARYLALTGKVFNTPNYPGVYNTNIAANAANAAWARAEAEHRALIQQYEVFKGVEKGLKNLIVEAVEEDYLEGLNDDIVG